MRRAVSIVFLLVSAFGAAGCKRTLHWKTIEDYLAADFHEKVPQAEVTVTCPETAVEAGLKFRCRATANDGTGLDIEVTLKDTAGSWESRPVR